MAIVIAIYMGSPDEKYMGSPDTKNPPNIDSVWADCKTGLFDFGICDAVTKKAGRYLFFFGFRIGVSQPSMSPGLASVMDGLKLKVVGL